MKTVNVTYMAEVVEDGELVQGEACMGIQVADGVALALAVSKTASEKNGLQMQIEAILTANELLKGRRYVTGSIKCFRIADGRTP